MGGPHWQPDEASGMRTIPAGGNGVDPAAGPADPADDSALLAKRLAKRSDLGMVR